MGTSKGPFVIHNHKHVAKQLAVTIDYRSILTPPQQIMFEKILRIGKGTKKFSALFRRHLAQEIRIRPQVRIRVPNWIFETDKEKN